MAPPDPAGSGARTHNGELPDPRTADARHTDPVESVAWLRRLYVDPGGNLVAMSTTTRFARGGLADFLRIRDAGLCRTPWCDAPIAEYDHITPAADGGETSTTNLQGLCSACNHAKQAPGWTQHAHRDEHGTHVVDITTPTGTYIRSKSRPVLPQRLTA
jgi:hypothetical protein